MNEEDQGLEEVGLEAPPPAYDSLSPPRIDPLQLPQQSVSSPSSTPGAQLRGQSKERAETPSPPDLADEAQAHRTLAHQMTPPHYNPIYQTDTPTTLSPHESTMNALPEGPQMDHMNGNHVSSSNGDDGDVNGGYVHNAERKALPPPPPTSHEAASEAEPVKVFIKAEPEKVETTTAIGIKKSHVEYVLRVDSSIPGMVAHGTEVRRRFSDFDNLHKILKHEYQGYFLPPLPEKSYIDGRIARESFLRLRRADLQAFLKGIASHPTLRECQAVSTFLLAPGCLSLNPAWTYLVNPPPSAVLQGSTSGLPAETSTPETALKSGLDKMVTWMSKVAQHPPKPKHEMDPEEMQLRQAAESIKDLHKQLTASSEIARSLCGKYEDLANELSRLGASFSSLSRFDEGMMKQAGQYTEQGMKAKTRAGDLHEVAVANTKQHSTWKNLSLRTAASLVTLHDYATLLPEALAALEARETTLARTWELEDDLAFKQFQMAQLNSESGSEEKKSRTAASIKHLEAQIKASHDKYLLLRQRNQAELRRVNLDRAVDFRRMLLQFSRCQASLVQQSASAWGDLVREMDSMMTESPV